VIRGYVAAEKVTAMTHQVNVKERVLMLESVSIKGQHVNIRKCLYQGGGVYIREGCLYQVEVFISGSG